LPFDGDPEFLKCAQKLAFGELKSPDSTVSIQTLSGTGALSLGFRFLRNSLGGDTGFYYSNPTWAPHPEIMSEAGINKLGSYFYYNPDTKSLDFDNMIISLRELPRNSVILLHACAHNPTGFDPSYDQWKQIAALCRENNLLPFFDMAYQGFASGNIDKDAESIRIFMDEGLEFLLAQSFSKNFGIYSERTGALHVFTKSQKIATNVRSKLTKMMRVTSSGAPSHGARIVTKILNDPELYQMWLEDLTEISGRIKIIRKLLRDKLVGLRTPGNWDHLVKQNGIFGFSGLTRIF